MTDTQQGGQIGAALATQEGSPAELVRKYQGSLSESLPSHIPPKQWISSAIAAVKRDPKLMEAARNDPTAFLQAVRKAASLGLTPGSDEFYLVPLSPGDNKPAVINGWVGWQGLVELMYRAGAVASVIAEVVYSKDQFTFEPGRDDRPHHVIDWDAGDRGDLRLTYAYAVMKDGATSKVVVMNKADIARIMSRSRGANTSRSPWKTDTAAMWLKTSVRQLAKWVPTSAEYRREQLRAAADVWEERQRGIKLPPRDGLQVDPQTGEVPMDEPLEGELLD